LPRTITECNVQNCIHWMPGDNCSARSIEVVPSGKDANCSTFEARSLETARKEIDNINLLGTLAEPFVKGGSNPEVLCSVKNCKHNRRGYCTAENIRISGNEASSDSETECNMYQLD